MKLTIHGPNLNDQSKGSFHVHTADCRDNRKEVRYNGSDNPYTGDFDSVIDVVEFIYSDIIAENPDQSIDEYVLDFHFAPCVPSDLPYVTDDDASVDQVTTPVVDTPADDHTPCDGCNGSGIYYGRGYVENGVFKGYTNTCYRCQGKGYQNEADRKRNRYYDNNVRQIRL
jgi:hypothetical protein